MIPDEIPVCQFGIFRAIAFDVTEWGRYFFVGAGDDLFEELADQISTFYLMGVAGLKGDSGFIVHLT